MRHAPDQGCVIRVRHAGDRRGFKTRPVQTAPAALNDPRKCSPCRPPQPVASRCHRGGTDRPCASTRRGFMLGGAALLASMLLPAARAAGAGRQRVDDAAYWAFADRHAGRARPYWAGRTYRPERSMLNANMLLTHSAAALAGHTGPARRDDRARALVDALCTGPAWVTQAGDRLAGPHARAGGTASRGGGIQHLVVDTEIAWALMFAWRAREALGVDQATADLIADRIISTIAGRFWRWPTLRLNQINWYARMYAAAATVDGDTAALHDADCSSSSRRFVDGARKPMAARRSRNLGAGYALPLPAAGAASNAQVQPRPRRVREHRPAASSSPTSRRARAGMPPLDSGRGAAARSGCERVLSRLLDPRRLPELGHRAGLQALAQGKKLGLAQAALLGIAIVAPSCAPHGRVGQVHARPRASSSSTAGRSATRGLPAANAFDVPSIDDNESSAACLAAARMQANAARPRSSASAAMRGRGAAAAVRLRPRHRPARRHHARLQHRDRGGQPRAFPYGGIDLARLFDGRQEVAGGVGGRPPASLRRGRAQRRPDAGRLPAAVEQGDDDPLELLEAPRGTGRNPNPYPRLPYAGAFATLRVRGTARASGIAIQTTHRFAATFIETEWRVNGANGKVIEALFPSWGANARVTAVNRRGERRGDHAQHVAERRRVVPRRERAQRLRGRRSQRRQERDRVPRPTPRSRPRPSPARP